MGRPWPRVPRKLGGDAVQEACSLLVKRPSSAKNAASALIKIGDVAQTCDAVRDVVVLRCQPQDNPGDRSAFLLNVEEAFGQPLGRELKALLSIAFHKIARERQELRVLAAPLEERDGAEDLPRGRAEEEDVRWMGLG